MLGFLFSVLFITKYEQKAHWLLLFFHNSTNGVYFQDEIEVLSTDQKQKYSILGILNENHKMNGYFEFLLEYPEIPGFNRWKQSINPRSVFDSSEVDIGYVPVNISWTNNSFGGLAKSTYSQQTYIEGSIRHSRWFYAIGAYLTNTYINDICLRKDCIPGTDFNYEIKIVKLWVRTNGEFGTYPKKSRINGLSLVFLVNALLLTR